MLAQLESVRKLAKLCEVRGGLALLVGGCVRDGLMGIVPKDFDVEIYKLSPGTVRELCDYIGQVDEVGKAFGVLKVTTEHGVIDVSLPRRESKIGDGHKDFSIDADPNMSVMEAARRRDFTINSLAQDPLNWEIHDYFGGERDIKARLLKATDYSRFMDDPLRVLRAVQFVGRFNLSCHYTTFEIMRDMVDDGKMEFLPKERLREEWGKLFSKSGRPSVGLELASHLGLFKKFPCIDGMRHTPQDPEWHPEGDVWIHTKMVCDQAASHHDIVVKIAAFCHDFGKISTTEYLDGHWRSRGHEEAGMLLTSEWLNSIGYSDIIDAVVQLVGNHLAPTILYLKRDELRDGTIKRLASRIAPATLSQLVGVARADHLGRGPFPYETGELPQDFPAGEWLLSKAKELRVAEAKPEPILRGKDLIGLGYKPGVIFGAILMAAEERHLETGATREELLTWVKENYANS